MRLSLAAKIFIPTAVFLVFVAVMGDLLVVALGQAVAQMPAASVKAVAAARTLAITYVAISILLVVALIAIYAVLVRGLTRRLRALTELTQTVEAGSFPSLVQVEGDDELADLTRAFSEMNRRLERSFRKTEAAHARLARAERLASLGQLASSVAHEINNPNGIVAMYAQLLLKRGDLAPEMAKHLQAIREESARIEKIVRELLDYARPQPPQRVEFSLTRFLREAVAALEPRLPELHLAVDTGGKDLRLTGDPDRLRQVITNLLVNARDAAGPGGEAVINAWEDEEAVTVTVTDNGPGIPADLRERVFEPFFTTKEKGAGSGFGLAICHRIVVEEHGGSIELKPAPKTGTTVELRFPKNQKK